MGSDTNDQMRPEGQKLAPKRIVIAHYQRKTKGILNPTLISLALVTYFISNQSLLTIMSKHMTINHKLGNGLEGSDRSFFNLVLANPAPEPASASGRSATSGSNRVPPMNGSIFGKRSVDGSKVSSNHQKSNGYDKPHRHEHYAPKLDSRLSGQLQYEPTFNTNDNLEWDQRPQTSRKSGAANYRDIITDIIEEFLASNNESDPEEASVAFCRMIVYECSQMLSLRSQTIARRRHKKADKNQIEGIDMH